jgi:hypothetical protein
MPAVRKRNGKGHAQVRRTGHPSRARSQPGGMDPTPAERAIRGPGAFGRHRVRNDASQR